MYPWRHNDIEYICMQVNEPAQVVIIRLTLDEIYIVVYCRYLGMLGGIETIRWSTIVVCSKAWGPGETIAAANIPTCVLMFQDLEVMSDLSKRVSDDPSTNRVPPPPPPHQPRPPL
jgi:hypothetical protein